MATYRGLTAISKRMGWSISKTIRVANGVTQTVGALAYLERGRGTRVIWITTDDLIHCWQSAQCIATKAHYRYGKRRQDRMAKYKPELEQGHDYAA
jgi:hypothetical protein